MLTVTDVVESWRDKHGMAYANGKAPRERVQAGSTVVDVTGTLWTVLRCRDGMVSLARSLMPDVSTVVVE